MSFWSWFVSLNLQAWIVPLFGAAGLYFSSAIWSKKSQKQVWHSLKCIFRWTFRVVSLLFFIWFMVNYLSNFWR